MYMGRNSKPVRLADKPLDIDVGEGDLIAIQTPGAGGNGRPGSRSKAALDADRRSGKFSAAFLKRHYGPEGEGLGDHGSDKVISPASERSMKRWTRERNSST